MMADNHPAAGMPSQSGKNDFDVSEKRVDELVVLSVSGNVDMLSAPWLTEAIDAALAKRPAGLVVDLSRVDFLGSAGISVLMTTHGNMGDSGRFAVVADGPATHRPLTLLGLNEIMSLHRTLDDAVSELSDR
ncbi:Anti-anti-sigma regulatory factor [Gordonia sp. KTR9] [Mycobacterium shimoidei]|uniref:Anti-sigma factor antagonist n=2 Tax=Mycobacterium shimoidei TaxID=29313 RepID=A0A375Z445_MYCSH|nr:Anti-anti-sigma regulatory factor [Gordonia sp. KTR9] [Mycobacterium shimoidei]